METTAGAGRTLRTVIALRAGTVALLVGAAVFATGGGATGPPAAAPLVSLAAIAGTLSAAYALALRRTGQWRWLADVQFAADVLLVSSAVALTGVVQSLLTPLYVLPVVAASAVQGRRGGVLVALLGTLAFGGLVAAQYTEGSLLAPLDGLAALPPWRQALVHVAFSGTGFLAVALLTGYLAESVQRAHEHLARASTQIADLQAFNQHVIDSLTGGLIATDREGRVLTFNRTAETITGLAAAQTQGLPLPVVLQFPPDLHRAPGSLLEDGYLRRQEVEFTRPDGHRIALGLTAAPLVPAVSTAGFILTFQDLTESNRQVKEAERQKRLAALGEMAAGIAHEVRNPLASMAGAIQVLQKELVLTEDQASLLDIVLRESERLDDTIRDFLDYARPQPRAMTRVDVCEVLRQSARLVRHSQEVGPRHLVEVVVPDTPLWIEIDEGHLRQIVWNLCSNALRAMPGGGRLTARASARWMDGRPLLCLEVEDEGVGIPSEELDRIFQPFQGSFHQGTGLGLAIVDRLVHQYGGRVNVASAVGQGTRVSLLLPGLGSTGTAGPAAEVERLTA